MQLLEGTSCIPTPYNIVHPDTEVSLKSPNIFRLDLLCIQFIESGDEGMEHAVSLSFGGCRKLSGLPGTILLRFDRKV